MPVSDIAFTPAVKAEQEKRGSRASYARMENGSGWQSRVTDDLKAFLAERDSFYLGTASADGQPYIQHRGGPKGFLRALDDQTLAMADFAGNAQYISIGNASENSNATIFLMDYVNQRRVKLWGEIEFIEDDVELLGQLVDPDYKARPQRVMLFHLKAWDANCPQHITPRFTQAEIQPLIDDLKARIAELEAQAT